MEMDDRREGVVEAWRGPSGLTLVVFLPDGGRAVLDRGVRLADLDAEQARALEAGAAPLSVTEALHRDPDGGWWLAQATGPAWAEAGVAADLVGTLFTRLDGSGERFEVTGAGWLRASEGSGTRGGERDRRAVELAAAWRAGRSRASVEDS